MADTGRPSPPVTSLGARLAQAGALIVMVLLVAWAWRGTEFDLGRLAGSLGPLAEFLGRMMPPETSVFDTVIKATSETIQISLLGTFLSAVVSVPLALMAAGNLSPAWLVWPTRLLLGALRGIPILLLALMFVAAIGLGPFPGVLAVAVHSIGMLAKFYAEAIENARSGPVEALDSAGAGWLQRIRFAVWPQVAPDLARDTLFRFELNLRESLVLGLVGAGGIGFYIQLYVRSFQYQRVATLTIVVLLMVVLVEQASVALRRRLQ